MSLILKLLTIFLLLTYAYATFDDNKYDWTNDINNGKDLQVTYEDEKEKIIVTLWVYNVCYNYEQNRKNHRIIETLK
jgi:hypothetical protein